MNVLIVRLGALGDILHTVPAAAALRAALPDARIDWLVSGRHRDVVDLVTVIDRVVPLEHAGVAGWMDVARRTRQVGYDVAIDFQGLLKSAVLARASGAARVIGFSIWHLREKTARPFYSSTHAPVGGAAGSPHVIRKNLGLLSALGVHDDRIRFPLADVVSQAVADVQAAAGGAPVALLNPGAAWPNKRWPASRFGEVAAFLRDVRGLAPVVLWGPGDEGLAREVVEASGGAGMMAPPTGVGDMLALSRIARLMVSGDTGPLHIAAAAGTPTVSLFGPTDPERNGPWADEDLTLSRFERCSCHYKRRCEQPEWCLASLTVAEVTAAIQQRLGGHRPGPAAGPPGVDA